MKSVSKIRTASLVGLIGSLVAVVLVILFRYLSSRAFYQSPQVFRTLTLSSSVIVILDLLVIMSAARRGPRRLQQLPTVEQRLAGYASLVATSSLCTLVATLLLCAIIVLTGNYNLLMLAMLLVVMLFFTYPNIYKIQADLALTPEQMRALFGSQYVEPSTESSTLESDPLEKHPSND